MKKTKRRKLKRKLSRRDTPARSPIMRKGGPHQRTDKYAIRARQTARARKVISDEAGSE